MAGTDNGPAPAAPMGTLESVIEAQAETMRLLQEQIAELSARVAPAAAPAVVPGAKFPTTVYRRGGKKGQVDHPGVDAKVVGDVSELEAHLKAGWSETMPKPEYDDERAGREAVEAAAKAAKAAAVPAAARK
jgi:hypothetical protein